MLAGDEVHVWKGPIDLPPAKLAVFAAPLAAEERERAARFIHAIHRDRYIAGRGILRSLLGKYTGQTPEQIAFMYGAQGKPSAHPSPAGADVRFNVSHSAGIGLFGFTAGREIGVDIEELRPDVEVEAISGNYFSPAEIASFMGFPPEERHEAFFRCWARKEAYIKARGGGLSIPLASFDVTLDRGRAELLRSDDWQRWQMHSLDAGPGFAAALVVEGSPVVVREFRLE